MRKASPSTGKKAAGGRSAKLNPSNVKLQRWIDLVATLLSHRYGISAEELRRQVPGYGGTATKASIDRSFERDKDELRAFGIPIAELKSDTDDEHRYSIDAREMYLPFLTLASSRRTTPVSIPKAGYRSLLTFAFEPDEMAAVLRGADLAHALGDPALDADIDSAIRKLTFDLVLAPALARAERPPVRMDGESQHADALREIGEALLRRKRVSFTYRTIGRDDATAPRTVEPYGLFFQQGHWYLAAHDVEKSGVRNYRVSRMTDVVASRAKQQTPDFTVPSSFRLTEHAVSREPWEIGEGEAEEMILEFRGQGGATRAAEKLGDAIAGQPRQRAFQVRRRDAFIRWALSFAGEVAPIAPASLVSEYRATVVRTLALYAESAS